jgi:peptide/nickel transport system ATP-binding protein
VSALDVPVQAQNLNLLVELNHRYGHTLVFIAHDLAVVKNVSDRVAVMYLGKLCETGTPEEVYGSPAHPYTAALLASIPSPEFRADEEREPPLSGELPSPIDPPSGCRFRTRCPSAQEICGRVEPEVRDVGGGHYVACHFPLVGEVSADAANEPVAVDA